MPKIYRISRSGIRLFYKIRHHRGHGIHSPFVFNLITKVIEEKKPYYKYQDIKKHLTEFAEITEKTDKYNLLSFRLVGYFDAESILELGSGTGLNTLYLTAPSSKVKCICFEQSEQKRGIARKLYKNWDRDISFCEKGLFEAMGKQDCIYLDLTRYNADYEFVEKKLIPLVNEDSFVIVKGIRTNKAHQLLWRKLKLISGVTVSLDLYHMGILFFNPKLHKRNYRISF